ncbi:MAG: DUF3011 domain-containing protein [Betaproteobacteria bacterium]
MIRSTWRWLLGAALLLSTAPAAQASAGFITCESQGYRYQYCSVNTQGRVIMLREVSTGNLCRQGRGWGYDNNGIWVDRGCRAEFSYGRDDGGGGGWGRTGQLTCESQGYRYRYCNADTQGRVSLARELSTGNLCRQGSGWGYDNGGIWVDRGCRGEFRYGRDSGGRNDAALAAGIIGALAIGAAISSSQSSPQPVAPPPAPRPPPPAVELPPAWAIGSYQAYDPDSGDIVQLVVDGGSRAYLRNETGVVVNQGQLRDGMIWWNNGKRSWFAREGPGVMVGDVDSGKHYYFRRNG